MERNLTTGSVFKNVILFSLPYLLSYFLQTLYGMADLFIIGQFEGVASTTAVSIGSQENFEDRYSDHSAGRLHTDFFYHHYRYCQPPRSGRRCGRGYRGKNNELSLPYPLLHAFSRFRPRRAEYRRGEAGAGRKNTPLRRFARRFRQLCDRCRNRSASVSASAGTISSLPRNTGGLKSIFRSTGCRSAAFPARLRSSTTA